MSPRKHDVPDELLSLGLGAKLLMAQAPDSVKSADTSAPLTAPACRRTPSSHHMDDRMTDSRTRCASQIAQIQTAITNWKGRALKNVEDAQAALAAAPDIALKTTEQLLEEALRSATRRVAAAEACLQDARKDKLLRRLFSVRHARRDVAAAEQDLERERRQTKREEEVARRTKECERRSALHRAHAQCKEALHSEREALDAIHRYGEVLVNQCHPAADAIRRGAWFAADTEIILRSAAEHARRGLWSEAAHAIGALNYQKLPPDTELTAWKQERENFVICMEQKRPGFPAVAPFQGLVEPTLKLAEHRFRRSSWRNAMGGLNHWSDRWHVLPRCLASPVALVEPIQWIVYWAFLTVSQEFAEDLTQARSHEDILTGALSGMLRNQLRNWAKAHLQKLGYPRVKAELGCLQMAGLSGEALTGADLGIIIHLQVGDVHVHKVALLQAKVSVSGVANIGSKPSGPQQRTQLQKLRDSERDFFLFYHTAVSASPAALPTVTPVAHFVFTHKLDEAALARSNISVDTRQQGWDLASFAAFGLCTPANALGKEVPAGKDPLEVLKAGGRMSLPAYMVVMSLSDDEHDYQHVMTMLDREGYRPMPMNKVRDMTKDKDLNGPTYDGPELG